MFYFILSFYTSFTSFFVSFYIYSSFNSLVISLLLALFFFLSFFLFHFSPLSFFKIRLYISFTYNMQIYAYTYEHIYTLYIWVHMRPYTRSLLPDYFSFVSFFLSSSCNSSLFSLSSGHGNILKQHPCCFYVTPPSAVRVKLIRYFIDHRFRDSSCFVLGRFCACVASKHKTKKPSDTVETRQCLELIVCLV